MFRKRGLALALAGSLIFTGMSVPSIDVNAEELPWTGIVGPGLGGGTGTISDPYLISSAEELAFLAKDVNNGNTYEDQYIKLTNDIDLNGFTWEPIGTDEYVFAGHFDGDMHTISGLSLEPLEDVANYGLFGVVENKGSIINLRVSDSTIQFEDASSNYCIGTVAGRLAWTASNISVDNVVISTNGGTVGGVFGSLYGAWSWDISSSVTIENSVTEQGSAGGIVGSITGSHLTRFLDNSFIDVSIENTDATYYGIGAIGSVDGSYIRDGIVTTAVTVDSVAGATAVGSAVGMLMGSGNSLLRVSSRGSLTVTEGAVGDFSTFIGRCYGETFSTISIEDNTTVIADADTVINNFINAPSQSTAYLENVWLNANAVEPVVLLEDPILQDNVVTTDRVNDPTWLESGNWTANTADSLTLLPPKKIYYTSCGYQLLYTDSTGTVQSSSPDEFVQYAPIPVGYTFGYSSPLGEQAGYTHYDEELSNEPIVVDGITYLPDTDFTYVSQGIENEKILIPYTAQSEDGSLQIIYRYYDTVIDDSTLVGEEVKSTLIDLPVGETYGGEDGDTRPVADVSTSYNDELYGFRGFSESVTIAPRETAKIYVNYVSTVAHNPSYVVERHWFVKDAQGNLREIDTATSEPVEVSLGQTVGVADADVLFAANDNSKPGAWTVEGTVEKQTAATLGSTLTFVVNLVRDADTVRVNIKHTYTYKPLTGDTVVSVTEVPTDIQEGHIIGVSGQDGITFTIQPIANYEGHRYFVVSWDDPLLVSTEDSAVTEYNINYYYSEEPSLSVVMQADNESYKHGDTALITATITNTGNDRVIDTPITFTEGGTFDATSGVSAEGNVLTIESLDSGESLVVRYRYPIPSGSETGSSYVVSAESTEGTVKVNVVPATIRVVGSLGNYRVVNKYYKEFDGVIEQEGIRQSDVLTAYVGCLVGISTDDLVVDVEIDQESTNTIGSVTHTYELDSWQNATVTDDDIAEVVVTWKRQVTTGSYTVVHEYYHYNDNNELVIDDTVRNDAVTDVPAGTTVGLQGTSNIIIDKVLEHAFEGTDYVYEFMSDSGEVTVVADANVTITLKYVRTGSTAVKNPSIKLDVSTVKDTYRLGETVVFNIDITNDGNTNLNNIGVTSSIFGGTWGNAQLFGKLDNVLNIYFMDIGTVHVTYSYTIPYNYTEKTLPFSISAMCEEGVTAEAETTVNVNTEALLEGNYKIISEFYTSKEGVETLVGKTGEDEILTAPVGIPTPIVVPDSVEYTVPGTEDTYTFALRSTSADTVTTTEDGEVEVVCKYVAILTDLEEGKGAYTIVKEFYVITASGDVVLEGTADDDEILEDEVGKVITVTPDEELRFTPEGGTENVYTFVASEPESIQLVEDTVLSIVLKYARVESGDQLIDGDHLHVFFAVNPATTVTIGQEVTYELKVVNDGTTDLKNVKIVANQEGKWSNTDGVVGDLESGTVSDALKFTVTIPEYTDDPEGWWAVEFLAVSDEITDVQTDEDNKTYVRYMITDYSKASVKLDVTTDKDLYKAGDLAEVTIKVTNNGGIPLHNLAVTNSVEGTWKTREAGDSAESDRLDVGETWELVYTILMPNDAGSIDNTITVDTLEGGLNSAAKTIKSLHLVAVTDILNSNLRLTTPAQAIVSGADVTFSYSVVNSEDFDLTNLVLTASTAGTFKLNGMTVGEGTEYVVPTLKSRDTLNLEFTLKASNDPGDYTLSISATTDEGLGSVESADFTVLSGEPGGTTEPGTSPTPTPPTGGTTPTPTPPTSGATPTPTPPVGTNPTPEPKFSLYLDSYDNYVSTMKPGDVVTIDLLLSNDGNQTLHNVQVAHTVSGSVPLATWTTDSKYQYSSGLVTIGTLEPGAIARLSCKVTLPTGLAAGTVVDYKFVATASEVSTTLANDWNVVTYKWTVGSTNNTNNNTNNTNTSNTNQTNKLTVTATDDKASYKPGDTITHTITIKNDGTAAQEDVKVSCTAAGTWGDVTNYTVNGQTVTIGNLAAGASVTVKYQTTIPSTISEGATFINTISAMSKAITTADAKNGNLLSLVYKNTNGTLSKTSPTSPKTGDARDLNVLEQVFEYFIFAVRNCVKTFM